MAESQGVGRRGFLLGAAGFAAGIAAGSSVSRARAAQPVDGAFDYDLPYPSKREPVLAKNCVATSQPLAAQAGLEMLRKGGNAIDAAVATAAALTVVEPGANGIGSDNFALIWTGGKLHGLNASGRSPIGLQRGDYDGLDRVPLYGWEAVTTPGSPSGWAAALERFGSLPMSEVLEPAIRYASEGYLVSPGVGRGWRSSERRYKGEAKFDAWRDTFLPNGRVPRIGELFRSEGHAWTLRRIAESMGRDFYEGEIADRIDAASRAAGGSLRKADLERHRAEWVDPISVDYRGMTLHEIPPNGQGLTALIALGILRHFDIGQYEPDSPEALHAQIEAMKLAFRDAHRYIADPAYMDVDVADLLTPGYLQDRAKLVRASAATDFEHGIPKPGGTVLLTAADDRGNMVSWIQSNYTGFGSGMVVPGTGIALQNRGGCFVVEEGHPNDVGPGKLPYHTIIPAFATKRTAAGIEPVMAFGVMGGYMQPQGHAQVFSRLLDHQQNPQAILDAPRWQVTEGLKVSIEPGFAPETYDRLEAMGHELRRVGSQNAGFGRGQIIYKLEDGYVAASDLRADGQAVGF
ncbi:MAG: gamma-glutamyltransferase family protein [Planctomycetota bacterium]